MTSLLQYKTFTRMQLLNNNNNNNTNNNNKKMVWQFNEALYIDDVKGICSPITDTMCVKYKKKILLLFWACRSRAVTNHHRGDKKIRG